MKIYSKSGDFGLTSSLNGQRLSKNDPLIHFAGTADELNSHLGLVKSMLPDNYIRSFIERIQKNLMFIMSQTLVCPAADTTTEKYFFPEEELAFLENEIDNISKKLPDRHEFVIPGKNVTEAQIHIARTVTRRAERLYVAANADGLLCEKAGVYLNRLSDYLFVLSQCQIMTS